MSQHKYCPHMNGFPVAGVVCKSCYPDTVTINTSEQITQIPTPEKPLCRVCKCSESDGLHRTDLMGPFGFHPFEPVTEATEKCKECNGQGDFGTPSSCSRCDGTGFEPQPDKEKK